MSTVRRLLCLAVLVSVAAVWGSGVPVMIAVQLTATTALIMGGTGHPLVDESPDFVGQFVRGALDLFIAPTGALRSDPTDPNSYRLATVHTPENFWPVYGTDIFDRSVATGVGNLGNCLQGRTSCQASYVTDGVADTSDYVTFGYSQSARIASIAKRNLIAQYRNADGTWTPVVDANGAPLRASFVLIGNPNRPNGGILQRFAGLHIPVLGVTFDGATPTDSCDGTDCRFRTVDIAWQYDGWADFPQRPLNLLADLNALAGIIYLHPNYTVSAADAVYQGTTGDTAYFLLPTARLPLLMPLARLGVPAPILDVLDAPLRVIVEWAYDRDVNPGDPTRATLTDPNNPAAMVRNLLAAIGVGVDDGLQSAGFGRPLGTTPAGPFGVGGAPPPANTPLPVTTSASRHRVAKPRGAAGPSPRNRAARDARPPTGHKPKGAGVGGHRSRF